MIKQCVILVVYRCRDAIYPKPTPPTVGDLDLKKVISITAREKDVILAESRDIVDYHSTNLFKFCPVRPLK